MSHWTDDSRSSTSALRNSHSRFVLHLGTPHRTFSGGLDLAPAISTAVPWIVTSTDPIYVHSGNSFV